MAGASSEDLLSRSSEVTAVLYRVLFLNFAVAAAKIALGLSSGAVSVLSDGFHSLTDTASNVVAIIGVRVAGAPPDEEHRSDRDRCDREHDEEPPDQVHPRCWVARERVGFTLAGWPHDSVTPYAAGSPRDVRLG